MREIFYFSMKPKEEVSRFDEFFKNNKLMQLNGHFTQENTTKANVTLILENLMYKQNEKSQSEKYEFQNIESYLSSRKVKVLYAFKDNELIDVIPRPYYNIRIVDWDVDGEEKCFIDLYINEYGNFRALSWQTPNEEYLI